MWAMEQRCRSVNYLPRPLGRIADRTRSLLAECGDGVHAGRSRIQAGGTMYRDYVDAHRLNVPGAGKNGTLLRLHMTICLLDRRL